MCTICWLGHANTLIPWGWRHWPLGVEMAPKLGLLVCIPLSLRERLCGYPGGLTAEFPVIWEANDSLVLLSSTKVVSIDFAPIWLKIRQWEPFISVYAVKSEGHFQMGDIRIKWVTSWSKANKEGVNKAGFRMVNCLLTWNFFLPLHTHSISHLTPKILLSLVRPAYLKTLAVQGTYWPLRWMRSSGTVGF